MALNLGKAVCVYRAAEDDAPFKGLPKSWGFCAESRWQAGMRAGEAFVAFWAEGVGAERLTTKEARSEGCGPF